MTIKFSVIGFFGITIILLLMAGCEEPYAPKPRGYFRITLPVHDYSAYEPERCPCIMDISKAAVITPDSGSSNSEYWFNIDYPRYKATIYMSYRPVNSDIERLTEDCRQLAMKHVAKASAIDEKEFVDESKKVYGLFYDLKGNSASPVQFWVTDSTSNFLRGSLYFYAVPNADSIAPVLQFIREDLRHMVESLRWKKN
ncbi:MAG: gliding motility lipoprotein GldD [Bacteroidota bacterium]